MDAPGDDLIAGNPGADVVNWKPSDFTNAPDEKFTISGSKDAHDAIMCISADLKALNNNALESRIAEHQHNSDKVGYRISQSLKELGEVVDTL